MITKVHKKWDSFLNNRSGGPPDLITSALTAHGACDQEGLHTITSGVVCQ